MNSCFSSPKGSSAPQLSRQDHECSSFPRVHPLFVLHPLVRPYQPLLLLFIHMASIFSSTLLSPSLSPFPSTELLRHHRPKAAQTSRQAADALHAVQPEGKQEGKTPIHGVCFYCLSSHPLKGCRGLRVGNSQAMTPHHHLLCADCMLCFFLLFFTF